MIPEAQDLYASGDFENPAALIDDILGMHVEFVVISSYLNSESGMVYGQCHANDVGVIIIELGIEAIWGLISPYYSWDEKAKISVTLAHVILHELAVSVFLPFDTK